MGWPSAQDPGNSEEQGGPAQTDLCATQLSDEILGSCTDEVLSSDPISSSGDQQSCSHTSKSPLESEEPTPSSEEQDERPQLSVLQTDGNKLSEKWINHIKGKEINSQRYQSESRLLRETPEGSPEELKALLSFCSVKVNLIHQREDSRAKKSSRHKKLQLRWNAETPPDVDTFNCTVPDDLLSRIYVKNTRATLAHIGAVQQHVCSQCPSCNSKRAELARSDFLKRRKTLLESRLLQEKIDEHLHTTDFLTRVAEAHRGFPRLSDDPRIIWKRVTENVYIKSSGYGKADSKQV